MFFVTGTFFKEGAEDFLPIALYYNYSAGMHPVPVMKWVDLSMNSHYSVFVLLGTRAVWQRIAATLRGSMTESVVDQQTNTQPQSKI